MRLAGMQSKAGRQVREMIEVGDEITNNNGETIIVTKLERGKHGILWRGNIVDTGYTGWSFLIPELPPIEELYYWYGWASRAYMVLASGQRVGDVAFWREDPRPDTIEEYDAEWERTIETMREEEHETHPTADRACLGGVGPA